MPQWLADRLLSWASELDPETRAQAERLARLPVVSGHVALMADAHLGKGSTVGAVIPTESAILPSAVGVDIGCGMCALRTDLHASDLPDSLDRVLDEYERHIPAGVGQGHQQAQDFGGWYEATRARGIEPRTSFSTDQERRAAQQFGTLGSGNHFLEVCLDEADRVWIVLHSGSRGIGNQLAQAHIQRAKGRMRDAMIQLEDPDLAYFTQGTPEFDDYITDLLWAQEYAFGNRERMVNVAADRLFSVVGYGKVEQTVNCHHNYTAREHHDGRELWITRKGAIRACHGDLGIIPGSMGTATYIVRGLGSSDSWTSCSHGAGRRMSRTKARKSFTAADLERLMAGKTWRTKLAGKLVDEIPGAYKDIETIMRDQRDLVEPLHTLRQVLNYKGT
jgi:tRNA-splicing ligase RtcB (3'-phosphate/5'-hydroxy nucleic acid ligase)